MNRDLFALRYGVRLLELKGEDQPHEPPKLSADGRTLVALVGTTRIGVWEVETGKQLGTYLGSYPKPIFFAYDRSMLVIGAGAESEVRVHPFGACGSHDQLLAPAIERTCRITESTQTLP